MHTACNMALWELGLPILETRGIGWPCSSSGWVVVKRGPHRPASVTACIRSHQVTCHSLMALVAGGCSVTGTEFVVNWEWGCGPASSLMGYNCTRQVNSTGGNETQRAEVC